LAYTVNLTVMTDVTHIGPLETQLQATLNEIPAYTWYGGPTGGLTFVDTLVARIVSDPRARSGGLQPLHYRQEGVLACCVRANRLES